MVCNNKKICIPLIIIAMIFSFICGEKWDKATIKPTKVVAQNIHYNDTLSLKGKNYSIDYCIMNAFFLDETSMDFNIALRGNKNVGAIKVIAKDQNKNYLKVDTNKSSNSNFLEDTIEINKKTTKIYLYVYPLTKTMLYNKSLNLSTIPFKTSILDVSLLKSQQIQTLKK